MLDDFLFSMNIQMVSKAKHSLRSVPYSIPCVVGMITGILLARDGVPWGLAIVCLLVAAGIFVFTVSPLSRIVSPYINAVRMLIFVFLGAGLAGLSGTDEHAKLVQSGEYTLEGTVIMAEVLRGDRQRIRFRPSQRDATGLFEGDLRLIVPRDLPQLAPGLEIRLSARLQPPLPRLLPGGFDFTAHAQGQGYKGTGFVQQIHDYDKGDGGFFAGLRYRLQQKLFARMRSDEAGVASALLVGLRGGIDPDLRESFRASGLAHLLAISGLHMVLFCGGVLVAVRAGLALMPVWSSRFPSLKIAAAVALPFGGVYLLMAGAPVSAVRAFGMMTLMILALLINRRGVTLHHVAVIAMLILAIEPQSLFDPAFQMSFAAVLALVGGWIHLHHHAISPPRAGWLRLTARPVYYTAGVMVASLLASVGSAPFVLHHFGVTTIWSLLGNILGMPLMAFIIMPAGAVALILAPLGLEALPLNLMGLGIRMLVTIAQYTETLPLSRLSVRPPPGLSLVFYTFGMVILIAGVGKLRRLSAPALCISVMVWVLTPGPDIAFTLIYGRPHAVVMTETTEALISRKTMSRFAHGVMLRQFPVAGGVYAPDSDISTCRLGYCLIPTRYNTVTAIIWRKHALGEACEEADIVLSHVRAEHVRAEQGCTSPRLVVTPAQLKRDGGMFIRIRENTLVVRQVNTDG